MFRRRTETEAIPGDVVGEILVQTREYIKANGWISGPYEGSSGQLCLGNALAHAAGCRSWVGLDYDRQGVGIQLMRALGFRSSWAVARWNDRFIWGWMGKKASLHRIELALRKRLIDYKPPTPEAPHVEPPLLVPEEWGITPTPEKVGI